MKHFIYHFTSFFLLETLSITSQKFSKCRKNGIDRLRNGNLRGRALRENLTLDALLKFGRALELSEQQASQVEKATSDVSAIKTKTSERPSRPC